MNGLARLRVWWPNIDADSERLCSQCVSYAQHSKDPANLQFQYGTFLQVDGK